MTETSDLLLVGCGNMGGAMLRGWLESGRLRRCRVVETNPVAMELPPQVELYRDAADLPADTAPDAVVLAVKPQAMADVLPAYRRLVRPGTVFLSIAAGKTLGFFEAGLGDGAAVVRAMPNTPAAVGRGITVSVANRAVSADQRALCDRLLAAIGETAWVEEEGLIDAVTGVSGSGPAYVFLMIEALAAAGAKAGLPEDLAMRLARATVAGSGELAHRSDLPAAQLRRNVTSPNGTTAAALEVLMAEDGLEALMTRAVAAATRRSRELAG